MPHVRLVASSLAVLAVVWGGRQATGADSFESPAAAVQQSERGLELQELAPDAGTAPTLARPTSGEGEEVPSAELPDEPQEEEEASPGSGGAAAATAFSGENAKPVQRRKPPLESFAPLTPAEDLVSRAGLDDSGLLSVRTKEGRRTLTLDPVLQRQLAHVMASYQTPHAAAVVLEPSTGRVLAMAQHAEENPEHRGLAVRAAFPAASVFKLITASALLRKGLSAQTEECFDGGLHGISRKDLLRRGSACVSLAEAMGKSTNVVFGKLTHQHLTARDLADEARLFGFNAPLDFELPVEPSPAVIPEGAFALAQTGAGFGDVYLSPLHGALLASVVANGGVWRDPQLLEPLPGHPTPAAPGIAAAELPGDAGALPPPGASQIVAAVAGTGAEGSHAVVTAASRRVRGAGPGGPGVGRRRAGARHGVRHGGGPRGGRPLDARDCRARRNAGARRLMSPEHAEALATMLEQTVTHGTARRIFNERGYRVEDAVGKTGTLADRRPFRDYSWFVGFAPRDNPKVAVAVVVVNDPMWRIRATWLGREAMRLALQRVRGTRRRRGLRAAAGGPGPRTRSASLNGRGGLST